MMPHARHTGGASCKEHRMHDWLRSTLRDHRGFVLFLVGLAFMRTAVADWNPVPSGSMRPTIIEGDVVLVNRVAYDFKVPLTDVSLLRLADPQRNDVVTFTSPRDGVRLVKRIVAVPGDVVAMQEGVLMINGMRADYSDLRTVPSEPVNGGSGLPPLTTEALQATERLGEAERRVQWMPNVQAQRSFGALTVPSDQYLMLGDSRDNSVDSRVYGFVPRQVLIGRAHHVVVSANTNAWTLRWARFWHPL
jgi:signal peptidase I